MAHESHINSVIVKINIKGSENDPIVVVEKVITQPGSCFESGFEGAANLLRERFECLCCKTEYVVVPLITKTARTRTEIGVTIADNDPIPIHENEAHENITEGETGSTLDEVVDSENENKQDDAFDDFKTKAETSLREDSFEMAPVEKQVHVDLKECDDRTPSEERSLKLQCLRSKAVIRLVRVYEDVRVVDAPVPLVGSQEQVFTCDICMATIKSRSNLIRHIKTHLGTSYSCSQCPKSFNRESNLIPHKKNFHQSEFRICEVCGRSKTCTKAEYHSHLQRRHPEFHIVGRPPKVQNFNEIDFLCIYCEPQSSFKSFKKLKKHLRVTHDRNFACIRCPRAFGDDRNLKRHIKSVHK